MAKLQTATITNPSTTTTTAGEFMAELKTISTAQDYVDWVAWYTNAEANAYFTITESSMVDNTVTEVRLWQDDKYSEYASAKLEVTTELSSLGLSYSSVVADA
jgi:hypothetical protein